MKILELLDSPNPDEAEIKRLGKLIGEEKEVVKQKVKGRELLINPEDYIRLRKEGKKRDEICEIFGIEMKVLQTEVQLMRDRGILKKGEIDSKVPRRFVLTKEEYLEESKTKSDAQIAREYGVSRITVSVKRYRWGLPPKNKKVTLSYTEYQIYKEKGMTDKAIEQMLGLTEKTIYRLKTLIWEECI
jgi:transposase